MNGLTNYACACLSTIIGGNNNRVVCSHRGATILGGSNMTTVSGNMLHVDSLFLKGTTLPTSDPSIPGVVWRDGTDLKISV